MKTRLFIVFSILAFSLTTALAQDFSSTGSQMMNTGSSYSSSVYGVGANSVDPMYSTSYSAMRRADGRVFDDDEDTEVDPGNVMPVGAPYIMLLFAAATGAVVALRRRKQQA